MSNPPNQAPFVPLTLIDLLRWRSQHQSNKLAYRFLIDGETEEVAFTYAELDQQARAVAALLQRTMNPGDRALLLFPPGPEYIAAFFGCLYAGVVAVPAYPPRINHPSPRLRAVAADSQATVALTTKNLLGSLDRLLAGDPDLAALRWIATDDLDVNDHAAWQMPQLHSSTLAFLQYTSGSTSLPKGVMVSHANLLHNSAVIWKSLELGPDDHYVIWLPPYHDMGLIGCIIHPLCEGLSVTLMSPVAFLQRPIRWLEAISRYGGTIAGAPNFAYDLCVQKITPEQRATLDLSSWTVAFNGAEPIHYATLERFAETFASCGFRREALFCVYGLAESTLMVTSGKKARFPTSVLLQTDALQQHTVRLAADGDQDTQRLAGSGLVLAEAPVRIVDPETRTQCAPDRIGEIWVAGKSVAQGYWQRPNETAETFQVHLADTGEGPFLRTGDLGFIHEGELFVTGRIKDLIIIRGRNYYPQDIELTVQQSHMALRPGCGAAFSIDVGDEEQLVVVQELERQHRTMDAAQVVAAIRQAVAEQHDLQVYAVALLKPAGILKTSSGKIQRRACREAFLNGSLDVLSVWTQGQPSQPGPAAAPVSELAAHPVQSDARSIAEIQSWLVTQLAERLKRSPQEIDVREPFVRYGLDSIGAIGISGDLEQWLGRRLAPTLVYEYPTIAALARYLADGTSAPQPSSDTQHAQGLRGEPIAIIGIGCRFPGADSPQAFWKLLLEGRDAIREVPAERWQLDDYYDPDPSRPGKMNTRWGGFLERVDLFDSQFFGIAPREALRMDPQQRLLLEVAWEALEDAGLPLERLINSSTGVFIGISSSEYGQFQLADTELSDAYVGTGNALSIAANRISYVFDLHGPSLAVDTACSSSLVAIHLACQSLWDGSSTLALVGGANLLLSPELTVNFSKAGFMSPQGRCKAFDAKADGYVRSEGVGVVVLKPLSRALADGDSIYAVIRGSAVNQDGRSNGLTAPSRQAQEAVLREAYRQAGVLPGQIDYIEAHGTGTALGDPIEVRALGMVLSEGRPAGKRCALGSAKSNIGHLEAAAGIAGLIKVSLALKHRLIPPSLHFHEPNPHIPFDDLPLYVQQRVSAWPEHPEPALAGVSSFGFGGTNAHVVLAEAPRSGRETHDDLTENRNQSFLLPLSARSEAALRSLAQRYLDLLTRDYRLHDICYSASVRRTHHDYRLALTFKTREELVERLQAAVSGQYAPGVVLGRRSASREPKLAFVFSGQGPQWWAMGRELLAYEPFRAVVTQCDELFRVYAPWSLLEELRADEQHSRLHMTEIAQPALFALQLGLVALWRAWGIIPNAVVGHSIGELAAACAAGVFSLEDAVRIVFHRGRIMQQGSGRGRTASIELPVEELQPMLAQFHGQLSIAAINGPNTTVVSGEPDALAALLQRLQEREVFCRLLQVDYAFHSQQMEPFQHELAQAIAGVTPQTAALPFVSTVTGQMATGTDLGVSYWARQIREPVRFAAAIDQLISEDYTLFLEIGPHPVLSTAIKSCLQQRERSGVVLASLRRNEPEWGQMVHSLGVLYANGCMVDWPALYPTGGQVIPLPLYPWQHERYWIDAVQKNGAFGAARLRQSGKPQKRHPLLGTYTAVAHPPGTHMWELELDLERLPYLSDHRIHGVALLPAAVYIEMIHAAAQEIFGAEGYVLSGLELQKALFLFEGQPVRVQLIMTTGQADQGQVYIYSQSEAAEQGQSDWVLHALGAVHQEKRVYAV